MIRAILLFFVAMAGASAADLYVDAYRFADDNSTGTLGVAVGDFNGEFSFEDQSIAIGGRKYLEFANIKLGVQAMISSQVADGALDSRVVGIEGGAFFTLNPYLKAGDAVFAVFMLDESNRAVVQVGFNLWH